MSAGPVALVLNALRAEPGMTTPQVARAVHQASREVLLIGEQGVSYVLALMQSEGMVRRDDGGRWFAVDSGGGWA